MKRHAVSYIDFIVTSKWLWLFKDELSGQQAKYLVRSSCFSFYESFLKLRSSSLSFNSPVSSSFSITSSFVNFENTWSLASLICYLWFISKSLRIYLRVSFLPSIDISSVITFPFVRNVFWNFWGTISWPRE